MLLGILLISYLLGFHVPQLSDFKSWNISPFPFLVPLGILFIYFALKNRDKYKGLIIACVTEKGCPMIYSRFDSVITELGLKKAMSDYLVRTDSDSEMIDE